VISEKVSRTAFILYLFFINLGAAHHLLVDPGMSAGWRIWNTSYAFYGAAFASMIHAFAIPAGIEAGRRRRGQGGGLFGWLTSAPWRKPRLRLHDLQHHPFRLPRRHHRRRDGPDPGEHDLAQYPRDGGALPRHRRARDDARVLRARPLRDQDDVPSRLRLGHAGECDPVRLRRRNERRNADVDVRRDPLRCARRTAEVVRNIRDRSSTSRLRFRYS